MQDIIQHLSHNDLAAVLSNVVASVTDSGRTADTIGTGDNARKRAITPICETRLLNAFGKQSTLVAVGKAITKLLPENKKDRVIRWMTQPTRANRSRANSFDGVAYDAEAAEEVMQRGHILHGKK